MRLLLIEDDTTTSELLRAELRVSYVIDYASSLKQGLLFIRDQEYDVIIVDWELPDGTGLDFCKKLRENHILSPILMLTGSHFSTKSLVTCLDQGADDYMTKPFEIAELKARLRALGRRQPLSSAPVLEVGRLTLDTSTHQVKHQNKTIQLTRKELLLLEYLMRHQGQVVSQEMILSQVWRQWGAPLNNTVAVHVKFLRDKVDKPFGTHLIKTVHGHGYQVQSP